MGKETFIEKIYRGVFRDEVEIMQVDSRDESHISDEKRSMSYRFFDKNTNTGEETNFSDWKDNNKVKIKKM